MFTYDFMNFLTLQTNIQALSSNNQVPMLLKVAPGLMLELGVKLRLKKEGRVV